MWRPKTKLKGRLAQVAECSSTQIRFFKIILGKSNDLRKLKWLLVHGLKLRSTAGWFWERSADLSLNSPETKTKTMSLKRLKRWRRVWHYGETSFRYTRRLRAFQKTEHASSKRHKHSSGVCRCSPPSDPQINSYNTRLYLGHWSPLQMF